MGKSIKEFKKESEDPNALPDGTSTTVASTGSTAKSVDTSQVRADEI